jgi:pimeloyl-ACP methyl ester carboxylesterase
MRVMQQQIRFCSTADGARIAYATVGTGPALIFAQWISHLELEWEEPRVRNFWETIAQHHTIVRYDKQGGGLSDRNRSDFSLDSEVQPIEAIVKELGLKSFVLWGQGQGAQPATAYAVKSPDRVSHLILTNPWTSVSFAALGGDVSLETFRALVLSNSRMASLAIAEAVLGNSFDASALRWYFRTRQESVTPEMFAQLVTKLSRDMDVKSLLPKISVPTLVAHFRNNRMMAFEAGRQAAAAIPGARFVPPGG